jgi:hypothetical protein
MIHPILFLPYIPSILVGGFNSSEKYYIVNGKDYPIPIYCGK